MANDECKEKGHDDEFIGRKKDKLGWWQVYKCKRCGRIIKM